MNSGCVELKTSYIPPDMLPNGWFEVSSLHNTGIEFLGFEKWSSVTYEVQGKINGLLTINTINTLVLTDEKDLLIYVNKTVNSIFKDRGTLIEVWRGNRDLSTKHTSQYIIYQSENNSLNQLFRIIGEVWNCGVSGASIICIGFVYREDGSNQLLDESSAWAALIGDPIGTIDGHLNKGLIYNIKCH
jgi:hypothetical protein